MNKNKLEARYPRRRPLGLALAALVCGLMPPFAATAAEFSVGLSTATATCDFTNIQSAIDAAASSQGPDTIRIATNQTYSAQTLRIGSQDLELIGGFPDCAPSSAANGKTTIDGAGGDENSVLIITGSGVKRLQNLSVIGGDEDAHNQLRNSFGGGIDFDGSGEVVLSHVDVHDNRAGFGGGVSVRSTGGTAYLTLEPDVVIFSNTAYRDGGGIFVGSDAELTLVADLTMVSDNHALGVLNPNPTPHVEDGAGGGIAIHGSGRALIGSPGYGGDGAINYNTARLGGGVAIIGGDGGDAFAVLFTTNPERPARMHNNSAVEGGAVYLRPNDEFAEDFGNADICAHGALLDANTASDGAAIYLDYESSVSTPGEPVGSTASFSAAAANLTEVSCGEHYVDLGSHGSTACAPAALASGVRCNAIYANRSISPGGETTSGAVIKVSGESTFSGSRTTFLGNAAGALVAQDSAYATLRHCLVVENLLGDAVVRSEGGGSLTVSQCTLAANSIGGLSVFRRANPGSFSIDLEGSIVFQPGAMVLSPANSANVVAHDNLVTETQTLPSESSIVSGYPGFIDAERGNYRLRAGSPAVDFAAAVAGNDRDLDGLLRDQQLDGNPDSFGERDLGAYERQQFQPLVENGDFDVDLGAWSNRAPGYGTWRNVDASNDAQSGELLVLKQSAQGVPVLDSEIRALTQCINVPAPGNYALTAKSRSRTLLIQTPDFPAVGWFYRADSGDCSGPITRLGELQFSTNTGWHAPISDALITIPAGEWSLGSSIQVDLVVTRNHNGADPQGAILGEFDDISLVPLSGVPTDAIFKHSFEE